MRLQTLSIETMISLACDVELISDYELSPSLIRLYFEDADEPVELDPEQARFFLHGLLLGYARQRPVPGLTVRQASLSIRPAERARLSSSAPRTPSTRTGPELIP